MRIFSIIYTHIYTLYVAMTVSVNRNQFLEIILNDGCCQGLTHDGCCQGLTHDSCCQGLAHGSIFLTVQFLCHGAPTLPSERCSPGALRSQALPQHSRHCDQLFAVSLLWRTLKSSLYSALSVLYAWRTLCALFMPHSQCSFIWLTLSALYK